nr:MAG TPA: hypothetical protein [Caudoviricetes sp.]
MRQSAQESFLLRSDFRDYRNLFYRKIESHTCT